MGLFDGCAEKCVPGGDRCGCCKPNLMLIKGRLFKAAILIFDIAIYL